jgi:hypothetical protein
MFKINKGMLLILSIFVLIWLSGVTSANAVSGQGTINVLWSGNTAGTSAIEVWLSGSTTAVSGTDYTISLYTPATPMPAAEPSAATTPTSGPSETEATNPGWTWILLLLFIPLTGVVIYYFAFVREK